MNTQSQTETPVGDLARKCRDVPIRVRLVSFVAFSHWLDEELEKLVIRWQDKAAPCALLNRR